jgi:hypothetical protein
MWSRLREWHTGVRPAQVCLLAMAVVDPAICQTYIDDRLLALDANFERIPADLDVEVLALVLCINVDGDVEVLDGLVPFVGQGGLLGLFLCACLGVGLFGVFWGRGARHGVLLCVCVLVCGCLRGNEGWRGVWTKVSCFVRLEGRRWWWWLDPGHRRHARSCHHAPTLHLITAFPARTGLTAN